jgi:16S rRNA (guanine527-N7)-methyltransferase
VSREIDELASGAESILRRRPSDEQLDSFRKYLEILQKWQKVHRLVGSGEPSWIVRHLFLDSLLFLRLLPGKPGSVADLGSGAGVPGIPIKIVRPEIDITLIESRERRVSFLSAVVRELRLEGASVVRARAEEMTSEQGVPFDVVLMRCAGDPGELMPIAARLAVPGGMVIASGPPTKRPIEHGKWVEVPGVGGSGTRRFAVLRVPG